MMEKGGGFQVVTTTDAQFQSRTPLTTDDESESEEASVSPRVLIEPELSTKVMSEPGDTAKVQSGESASIEEESAASIEEKSSEEKSGRTAAAVDKTRSGGPVTTTHKSSGSISPDVDKTQSGSVATTSKSSGSISPAVDKTQSSGSVATTTTQESSGRISTAVDKTQSSGSVATTTTQESSGRISAAVDKTQSSGSVATTTTHESSGRISAAVDKTPSGGSIATTHKSSGSTAGDVSKAMQLVPVAGKHGGTVRRTRKSLPASNYVSKSGVLSVKFKRHGRSTSSDGWKSRSSKETAAKYSQAKAQSSVSSSTLVVEPQSKPSKRQSQKAVRTNMFASDKKAAEDQSGKAHLNVVTKLRVRKASKERRGLNKTAYESWLTTKNLSMSDMSKRKNSREILTVDEQEDKKERCKQSFQAWVDSKTKEMREKKLKKAHESATSTSNEVEARNRAAFQAWTKKKSEQRQRESELLAKKLKEKEEETKKVNTSLSKEAYKKWLRRKQELDREEASKRLLYRHLYFSQEKQLKLSLALRFDGF